MHRRVIAFAVVLVAAAGLYGCTSDQEFEGAGVYAFAMDENTPAIMESEMNGSIYWTEQRIDLPIMPPTDAQLAALASVPVGVTMWGRGPWVVRGDLPVELDVTVSNLELPDPMSPDASNRITLTLNGINEFDEYVPGIEETRQGFLIHFSQWERQFDIKKGERRTFSIREEELDEVAIALATVVNGAPNPNEVVYFANQSAHDPRALPYIPPVIPGLVGFRVGLMSTGTARVVAETSVRTNDLGNRRAQEGTMPWAMPAQRRFVTTDVVAPMP